MSYQVIARKWRPQSFDEVSGQTHVTTALRNAIRSDRIPHAMLLTGPRGVGKTTLARLIARCLNCEKGPTDTPCGTCTACVEITEGRSIDVQEIDAASRTGVDDMREVIESIRYAAAPGKHRIYVIDEVHMLSNAAFNALLKTLEEPPPRSLFVFATTNPEKIPHTVLSRCQRHDLRRIALSSVSERLAEICAAEKIEISPAALAQIAREGDGSMRDAQTLLDQIIASASDSSPSSDSADSSDAGAGVTRVDDAIVAQVLDLVDRRVVRGIIEACIASDPKQALELVGQATSGGSEAPRIAEALLELLRDLTVLRVAPDGPDLFEGPDEERAELIELAGQTEPARLRRMFRALMREIEDLSWAPQPSAVLEMAIIRLATMPAGDDVASLLSRLDRLERRLAGGGTISGGNSGPTGRREPASGKARAAANPAAKAGRDDSADGAAWTAPPEERPTSTIQKNAAPRGHETGPGNSRSSRTLLEKADPRAVASGPEAQAVDASNETPLGGGAPPDVLFDRLRTRALEMDRSKFASLDTAKVRAIRGNLITLDVPMSFHADRLRARSEDLERLASEIFGRPVRIAIEVTAQKSERDQSSEARETSRRRRQEALNSESVNLALEVLDGEIVEIRPLGERP